MENGSVTTGGDELLDYWVNHLQGIPMLQLPTDYPRPHYHQMVEAEVDMRLSPQVCKSILQLSLMEEVSPFTIILTAFTVLLHKYTREEDIVVGSSSTSHNPLVLRIPISEKDSFRNLVKATEKIEENAASKEILYEKLYNKLRDPTGTGSSEGGPLFQVRFFNVSDVSAKTLEAASCDWTVFVEQLSDSKALLPLKLKLVYNTILFSRERMEELLRQIEQLLSSVCRDADRKVAEISLLTEEAKKVIPDPAVELDSRFFGSIQSCFTANALKHPKKPAIVYRDRTYTYDEVEKVTNQVANYLVAGGIKKGDIVAIFAHRSTAIVFAILGILKAGATFTVIDPAYPPERQKVYLEVAQPRGFITIKLAGDLETSVRQYIKTKLNVCCELSQLDGDDNPALQGFTTENPNIAVTADDIGTLSFTSGSTGIPKGVRGRHISYTHFYPWMMEEFNFTPNDRFSLLSGIAHDPIQRDIFTPFFMGAAIHIPDASDIGNPGQLALWMSEHEITVTHLTPAMGQLLTANADTQMSKLKVALFVGDILTKRDILKLQNLAPNVTVVNMYGTTETQRAVSYMAIKPDHPLEQQKEILPAGIGMKDVQLLILTPDMRMAGIGEMGEIYTRSPHMAAGYLNLEEATNMKFILNPFTKDKDYCGGVDRLYKTGDVGRYMPTGIVECAGRADDQVKIRGFRIELGEIDTFLSQHPSVRENVTIVRRDINEEHTLMSYFVPTSEQFNIADIRDFLRKRLPTYAVPSIYVPLIKMPLTPNGKIDKNKLPFPDTALAKQKLTQEPGTAPPLTKLEAKLVEIWSQVLGIKNIGIHDNFFDIGGHSIVATQLIFQMRMALKVDLPLNLLFENPTVAGIAQTIKEEAGELTFDSDYFEKSSNSNSNAPKRQKVGESFTSAWDPANEIILDSSITPCGPFTFNPEPLNILLTGATGFLGAFILRGLLENYPNAKVICPVRCDTAKKAFARIKQNLDDHLIWKDQYESRITAILGDLGKINLGWNDSVFNELASTVDQIYHNGAMVHWVYPYSKLKAINVESTKALLKLSVTKKMKPFHFISSTSVFDSDYYVSSGEKVKEDDDMKGGYGLTVGYGQSKWVAENLILEAGRRGIPVTITRPGYIVGDTSTGVTNTDDFLWRLVKGCVEMGTVPLMRNKVNMCPVDYVANCIVHIGSKESCLGRCYHMTNPYTFRFDDYFGLLMDYGWECKPIDYIQWRQDLMSMTLNSSDSALYPLLHFVLDDLPTKSKSPELDAMNTLNAIADSTIRCSPMEEVMGIYFSFLVQSGFLPSPTTTNPKKILPKLNVNAKILTRSDRRAV